MCFVICLTTHRHTVRQDWKKWKEIQKDEEEKIWRLERIWRKHPPSTLSSRHWTPQTTAKRFFALVNVWATKTGNVQTKMEWNEQFSVVSRSHNRLWAIRCMSFFNDFEFKFSTQKRNGEIDKVVCWVAGPYNSNASIVLDSAIIVPSLDRMDTEYAEELVFFLQLFNLTLFQSNMIWSWFSIFVNYRSKTKFNENWYIEWMHPSWYFEYPHNDGSCIILKTCKMIVESPKFVLFRKKID